MKIKIIKIIIVITVIIWWMGRAETVWAVIKRAGNIEVITDEPLFADSIVWYPGLAVEKSFQVKNLGRGAKTVQIETENETETGRLAGVLGVRISRGDQGIYGVSENKTLRNFFETAGVSLGEVFPDDSGKTFSVAVMMPVSAGNEYQGARAKFDLRIGFLGESQSSVTVSGGGTAGAAVTATPKEKKTEEGVEGEGGEGTGGQEGGRQIPGEAGKSAAGEVKGAETNGFNWGFWAMIGGILVFGGLAGWAWLRLRRKQVY